jgi:hypothetical protein
MCITCKLHQSARCLCVLLVNYTSKLRQSARCLCVLPVNYTGPLGAYVNYL